MSQAATLASFKHGAVDAGQLLQTVDSSYEILIVGSWERSATG